MPYKPRVPCKFICCSNLVNPGEGYCSLHNAEKYKTDVQRRGNAKDRGYDATWGKVRKIKLNRNPLCERCNRVATLVHHIKPISQGGERFLMDNLMSLCVECHGEIHGSVTISLTIPKG